MTIEVANPHMAASLSERMQYSKTLAEASIIPRAFQKKPADVLVAVEYGHALGIAPIVAISEINVINGTPSLSASLMAALAREAGHKVRVTGDDRTATCTIVRADDPDFEHTATWDEKKARDAGLWGRGHWAKDAGTMLRWRAISECVRFACSEVLGGLKYTPEEVADFQPAATVTVTQQHDDTPLAQPEPPQGVEQPANREQLSAIKGAMETVGIEKGAMLALAQEVTGRTIAGATDLTADEAELVLAAIESSADEPEVYEAELVADR